MGIYTDNGILIGAPAGVAVNWAGWKGGKVIGGLYRIADPVGTNITPRTMECDAWMDKASKANRTGLIAAGMLTIGVIRMNPAWAVDAGWSAGEPGKGSGVEGLLDGTIPEVVEKLLKNEPHIASLVREVKVGSGRAPTGEQLKDLPDWGADGWAWMLDRYWKIDNTPLGDGWTARALRVLINGVNLMADNGYLPSGQALQQSLITSDWYMDTYGNIETRDQAGRLNSWPQGNHWKASKVGYFDIVNGEDLTDQLSEIADAWEIERVGAAVPGRSILGWKVTSNLTSALTGGEPFEAYSVRLNQANLDARFPTYAARRNPVVDPEPEPEPTPKRVFAAVKVDKLRVRETAGGEIAGFMIRGAEVEILERKVEGGVTWGRFAGWCAVDPGYCRRIRS
jgi:hypothetical protein